MGAREELHLFHDFDCNVETFNDSNTFTSTSGKYDYDERADTACQQNYISLDNASVDSQLVPSSSSNPCSPANNSDYTLDSPHLSYDYESSSTPGPMPMGRRGRRAATSTSKMADYARNYRAMKKNQLQLAESRSQGLMQENRRLADMIRQMNEDMASQKREIEKMRRVMNEQSGSGLGALGALGLGEGGVIPGVPGSSVCLHFGPQGVTFEVCAHCIQKAKDRLTTTNTNCTTNNTEPSNSRTIVDTPLFNGDFDSIVDFIK